VTDHVLAHYDIDGKSQPGAHVETQAELDALLDRLAAQARPTWLTLVHSTNTDSWLSLGLGRDFSFLTFMEPGPDGRRFDSVGTLDSPQDADFEMGGTPTSMPTGSAIEVNRARVAAGEYLRTGRRPDVVAWQEFEVASKEPVESIPAWEDLDPGPSSTKS
jgi:hypothetical protein